MQSTDARSNAARSNAARSEQTRRALVDAARSLFVERGFDGTPTPAIVERAGLTRGALYHHFADKRELFRAVAEEESAAVAAEIEASAPADLDPAEALRRGSISYLDAMAHPGRTRLLLLDGPAVLGLAAMTSIDDGNAARTLREGLDAVRPGADNTALASLLSAAFDRAALEIGAGTDPAAIREAMLHVIDRVAWV